MSRSRPRSHLLVLVALTLLCLALLAMPAFAQEDPSESPSPSIEPSTASEPAPEPTSSPPPPPPPSSSPPPPAPAPVAPTNPPTGSPPPSPAPLPDPIFSTSDDCVACQSEFPVIRNCSALLPASTSPTSPPVNLTMMNQVLPFFSCICPNNGTRIDALQHCSTCFRSTGQLIHLDPHFQNVTHHQVKGYKHICKETNNGSKIPSSAAVGVLNPLQTMGWAGALILSIFIMQHTAFV